MSAPCLIATNRERHTLNYIRARQFAKKKKTILVKWETDHKDWEQKPIGKSFIDEAMQDPCFYEYFVKGADGYITDNINCNMINGTPIRLHSLSFNKEQNIFYHDVKQKSKENVIHLPFPPLAINVILTKEDATEKLWKDITLFPGKVILPIVYKRKRATYSQPVPLPSANFYPASTITIKSRFPIELAFAMTVHKAMGRTFKKIILSLSKRKLDIAQMSYESIYVALSRVKHRDDINLFLNGDNPSQQWQTMEYITDLKQEAYIQKYLRHYNEQKQTNNK